MQTRYYHESRTFIKAPAPGKIVKVYGKEGRPSRFGIAQKIIWGKHPDSNSKWERELVVLKEINEVDLLKIDFFFDEYKTQFINAN